MPEVMTENYDRKLNLSESFTSINILTDLFAHWLYVYVEELKQPNFYVWINLEIREQVVL
jgi:hypothetical protein